MLPKYEICRRHIIAYQKRTAAHRTDNITFPIFWNYKTSLETGGQTLLDEKNIVNTVSQLCGLLSTLGVKNDSFAEGSRITQILRNFRPYYSDISQVILGSGKINSYRDQIESIYERMDKKATKGTGHGFSIVAKSAILMAIWGQVPRFDAVNRKRFERWIHWPAPEKLPCLTIEKRWYRPDEFYEIVEALDKWVMAWSNTNGGKSFQNCFSDFSPGIPPGRHIDIIYHWELPAVGMHYRLQTGGSYYDKSYDDTVNNHIVDR